MRDLVAIRVSRVPTDAWQQRIAVLDVYEAWLRQNAEPIVALGGNLHEALASIAHERESHTMRIALTGKQLPKRVWTIASLLRKGGYRYFYGWKSAARDLVRTRHDRER
jgi:hypothetical protein